MGSIYSLGALAKGMIHVLGNKKDNVELSYATQNHTI